MALTYRILLGLHVLLGSLALVTFWGTVLARKGGRVHRRFGRAFTVTMAATVATAALLCAFLLADPLAARPPQPGLDGPARALVLREMGSGLLGVSLAAGALLAFGLRALRRLRSHRSRSRGLVEHLVGLMGAAAIGHGALGVNVAGLFTDDLALAFGASIPIVLAFGAAIAWTARRWRLGRVE